MSDSDIQQRLKEIADKAIAAAAEIPRPTCEVSRDDGFLVVTLTAPSTDDEGVDSLVRLAETITNTVRDELHVKVRIAVVSEDRSTLSREITEADILAFADLTDDHNRVHVDEDFAAKTQFGAQIAHGMFVASIAIGLADVDDERVVALRLVNAEFSRPAFIGDKLRVTQRVAGIELMRGGAVVVTFRWAVINQDQKMVARMVVAVVWRVAPVIG